MNQDIEFKEPITIEERAKWETTQNLSKYIKIRNKASDTFTPLQIKFLTKSGRKHMGIYGILALLFLFILVVINAYALRDESIIVIFNSLLAFVFAIFNLEKLIASLLHMTPPFK